MLGLLVKDIKIKIGLLDVEIRLTKLYLIKIFFLIKGDSDHHWVIKEGI